MSMQNVWGTSSGQAPFWPDDYFVPNTTPNGISNPYPSYFDLLNYKDWDMGVSGIVLMDDNYYDELTGKKTGVSMAITSSKRGDGYVMLQSGLGQYTFPDQVVAEFLLPSANTTCSTGPCDETRTLAYWNPYGTSVGGGLLLAWPWHETLSSFQWVQPLPGGQYTFQRAATVSNPFSGLGAGDVPSYPGGNLSVTVASPPESPAAAVVWATSYPYGTSGNPYNGMVCGRMDGRLCPGFLLAYSLQSSPAGSLNQIWPATLPTLPDFAPAPYAIPTAVNGKVYAPAYGLADGSGGYTFSGVQVYGF
jgi:hypothetical protein